jgi:penicillin-insensitive murein endopeptidase
MRLSRNRNWGTPDLVSFIDRFASDMQQREHWSGLLIGDMSQPRGGPMITGHASHQIGLDVDIWFMPMPQQPLSVADRETVQPLLLAEEHGRSVIKENWQDGWVKLLRRAASYPEVARVFVHPAIKKALCQSPLSDKSWQHKIRAYWGHNDHFHVRLRCPSDMASCVPQQDPPGDDGCGKDLDTWLALVSEPPKPPSYGTGKAAAGIGPYRARRRRRGHCDRPELGLGRNGLSLLALWHGGWRRSERNLRWRRTNIGDGHFRRTAGRCIKRAWIAQARTG